MRATLLLLALLTLLAGCAEREVPEITGPRVGQIPLLDTPTEIEPDVVPRRITTVIQSHRTTVADPELAFYSTGEGLVDVALRYDDEMERLGWRFIDALQFGDGGTLRRYHRGQERAILAFHPADDGTDYALLYGRLP